MSNVFKIIFFLSILACVIADEYCIVDQRTQTCRVNPVSLLSQLQQSSNPFAGYMQCSLLTTRSECNQRGNYCSWARGSFFTQASCQIKQSSFSRSLSPCVDSVCRQDLVNSSSFFSTRNNCNVDSFISPPPNNDKFCEIVSTNAKCYNQGGGGNCMRTSCVANRLYCVPPQITMVDSAVMDLMNLKLRYTWIFTDEGLMESTSVINSNLLDSLLGFSTGTMDRYFSCYKLDECSDEGYSQYKRELQQDKSQPVDAYWSDRGWGIIVISFSFCFLGSLCICGCIQQFRRRYYFRNAVRRNDIEMQNTAVTAQTVSEIMGKLKHSKFQSNDENVQTWQQRQQQLEHADNGDQTDEDELICAICYEGYEDGQDVTHLRCDHMYHMRCIQGWVKTKGKRAKCPLCSSALVEEPEQ